jgi:hypothetical protein
MHRLRIRLRILLLRGVASVASSVTESHVTCIDETWCYSRRSAGCTGATPNAPHGYLGDVPPTEFETAHYAALAATNEAA